MKSSRILFAAAAVAFLSSAALAQVPSAAQVSVPPSGETKMHHGKMAALFNSPDEFMMFHIQLHDATRGMPKDQKRAYRKSEMQKLKAMTGQERAGYMHDLDTKWAALSPDRRAHVEQHIQAHQERRAEGGGHHQHKNAMQQQQDGGQPPPQQ